MNGDIVKVTCGWSYGAVALAAAALLAPGSLDPALAAKKDQMVDYSAPVQVRVKKPASAAEIDPNSFQTTEGEMAATYDGKQMEPAPQQRRVSVPSRIWSQGDLDELPPPAWEDCKTTKPRFRPLEGPHGRVSAGVIYRDFGNVEFTSHSMLTEDLENEYYNLPAPFSAVISPGGLFEVNEGDYWKEDVDAGGPYIAFDLLFPISENFRIGQQVSFSYSRTSAANELSTLNGNLTDDVTTLYSERAQAYMHNKVFERLDADIYTLSLGPLAEVDLGPVFIQGAAGLAINMVQFNADVREQLYIDTNFDDPVFLDAVKSSGPAYLRKMEEDKEVMTEKWEDGNHGTKFLFGFYLQGLLGVQVSERWSVAGFARYDWNEPLEGDVGYSSFRMDLDAFSAGAQVGFGF